MSLPKEPSVETTPAGETPPEETPVTPPAKEPEVKTYTEEEYQKAIQSASSKGKNEILKSLGIETVEDGKTKLSRFDELLEIETKYGELETKHTEVLEKQEKAETEKLLTELGIEEEGKELFLTLLAAEQGEGTRLEKGQRVKEKLIKMLSPDVKFGAGKTPAKDPTQKEVFEKLQKL